MPKIPKELGKVFVPFGALPYRHETEIANLLIHTGDNVTFIKTSSQPTPDIRYQKLLWEIKSPIGKSSRTIENNLRNALRQSSNIILDLRRTAIPDQKCLTYLTNHISNFHSLKNLLIVNKNSEILQLNKKDSCFIKIHVL